jgi:hypothetical protein
MDLIHRQSVHSILLLSKFHANHHLNQRRLTFGCHFAVAVKFLVALSTMVSFGWKYFPSFKTVVSYFISQPANL